MAKTADGRSRVSRMLRETYEIEVPLTNGVSLRLEAFADQPGPQVQKYICAPCSNCKGQFRDILQYYNALERSGITYGGLVELIVNAMVDVKEPFIEGEMH